MSRSHRMKAGRSSSASSSPRLPSSASTTSHPKCRSIAAAARRHDSSSSISRIVFIRNGGATVSVSWAMDKLSAAAGRRENEKRRGSSSPVFRSPASSLSRPRRAATFRAMNVPKLRSPYVQLGGLHYIPRLLDKIRLHAAGQLPAEYQANLGGGFDGRAVSFLWIE